MRMIGLEQALETTQSHFLLSQLVTLMPRSFSKLIMQLGLEPNFLICQIINSHYLQTVYSMLRDQICGAGFLIPFIDGEFEAQIREITCPRSYSW